MKATMKILRTIALYLSIYLLPALASAQTMEVISVPIFKVEQGSVFYALIKINDGAPTKFLIDTGSTYILISDQLASRLNLQVKPAIADDGTAILDGGKPARLTYASKFQFGSKYEEQTPLIVVSSNKLQFAHNVKVDGILGANFFAEYATLFDFIKGQITLIPSGKLTLKQITDLNMVNFDCIPIFEDAAHVPALKATLDDIQNETLIVDTGSIITSVSRKAAEKLHLKPVGDKLTQSTVFGSLTYSQTLLGKFQIGNLQYPLLSVCYQDSNKMGPEPGIGLNILARSRFLLDYPAKKIYIERPAKPSK